MISKSPSNSNEGSRTLESVLSSKVVGGQVGEELDGDTEVSKHSSSEGLLCNLQMITDVTKCHWSVVQCVGSLEKWLVIFLEVKWISWCRLMESCLFGHEKIWVLVLFLPQTGLASHLIFLEVQFLKLQNCSFVICDQKDLFHLTNSMIALREVKKKKKKKSIRNSTPFLNLRREK